MLQYRFKRSFSNDPNLGDRLFELLEVTFPGLNELVECGRKLGVPWEAVQFYKTRSLVVHAKENCCIK